MNESNERDRRDEMLRKRGFYAKRCVPNGPVKIREVETGRGVPSAYWVTRAIVSIGGIDVSTLTDEQVHYYLTAEEPSTSANASAEPTYSEIGFKRRAASSTAASRAANAAAQVILHCIITNHQ
jgi:hypothetical protein